MSKCAWKKPGTTWTAWEISATRNTKSRLAIKSRHPLWVVIKCSPSRAAKPVKCPGIHALLPGRKTCQLSGVCPGREAMLKLRFDWYISWPISAPVLLQCKFYISVWSFWLQIADANWQLNWLVVLGSRISSSFTEVKCRERCYCRSSWLLLVLTLAFVIVCGAFGEKSDY